MASAVGSGQSPDLRGPGRQRWRATSQSGRLSAGDRLPPQRELAEALGVTVPTVTRAYSLAARRGLVGGEVGRGTFVRPAITADTDRGPGRPVHQRAAAARASGRDRLAARPARRRGAPRGAARTTRRAKAATSHRAAGADWIARRGVHVTPLAGRWSPQARSTRSVAALAGQLGPGDTLLVEELTYAGLLEAVRLLGHRAGRGRDGRRRRAARRARPRARRRPARARSRCSRCCTTPPASRCRRRAAAPIADVVARRGLHVIEDDIYGMLAPEAPAAGDRAVHAVDLRHQPLQERRRGRARGLSRRAGRRGGARRARDLGDDGGDLAAHRRDGLRAHRRRHRRPHRRVEARGDARPAAAGARDPAGPAGDDPSGQPARVVAAAATLAVRRLRRRRARPRHRARPHRGIPRPARRDAARRAAVPRAAGHPRPAAAGAGDPARSRGVPPPGAALV